MLSRGETSSLFETHYWKVARLVYRIILSALIFPICINGFFLFAPLILFLVHPVAAFWLHVVFALIGAVVGVIGAIIAFDEPE